MTQKQLFAQEGRLGIKRSAEISECGHYRWWLRRSWNQGEGTICFVMLNPSTADALQDDPTIRRCIAFSKAWGYATLSVRNLFAYRATDPKDLKAAGYPTGGTRGDAELIASQTADCTICAWGANAPQWRVNEAMKLLGGGLLCLGKTKAGHPKHPLYVPASQVLEPFERE